MSMLMRVMIGLILLPTSFSFAQGHRRRKGEPFELTRGRVISTIDTLSQPLSLRELVQKSELIVEGSVESVFPSRLTIPDRPTSVETDLLISVKRVLKGPADKVIERVVVSQLSGKWGELEVVTPQDPLMQSGEHYILFLVYDDRPRLPDYFKDGTPRCVVTGVWTGKLKIIDHSKIAASSEAPVFLKAYDESAVDEFVRRISELLVTAPKNGSKP